MPLCLPCAIRKRDNCPACASLAPIPAHRRVSEAARTLIRNFRATDPATLENARKAAAFQLKEEAKQQRATHRRNLWKKHDRQQKYGEACPISQCVCKEVK